MSTTLRRESWPGLAGVTLAAGALVLAFWAVYFADATLLGLNHPLIQSYEAAFPAADGVFAAALLATGIAALRKNHVAYFFLVVAASMSAYLGVLDTTFYLRHGFYVPFTADAVTELVINALCVVGGVGGLRYAWQHWAVVERRP